ncbi:MAG: transglutaminase family protein [Neomegalonema sp.]|nr:transglutaminase family protein [Neomegalonema sp.]
MRLRFGCSLTYELIQPTPMIILLNAHYSRASDLERPDTIVCNPSTHIENYRDIFGNWCARLVAPTGRFTIGAEGVIRDPGLSDPVGSSATQHRVQELPADTLTYLLPSRYCENDVLSSHAWDLFAAAPLGWARVQAVCDYVHKNVAFGYEHARATRTASETLAERRGVCRDFAHLAIALCRALNIPARYCTGYVSDIGQPSPYPPMDFAAWMEVYLGGRWWVFDPRNNDRRFGRVLVARGRDAADVPLTHGFGPHTLTDFRVWIDVADS